MVKHRAGSPWVRLVEMFSSAAGSTRFWQKPASVSILPLQRHAVVLSGLKVPDYNHVQTFCYFIGGWNAVIITIAEVVLFFFSWRPSWQTGPHTLGKGNNVGPLNLLQSWTSRGSSGPIQSDGSKFWGGFGFEHRGEAPRWRAKSFLAGDLRAAVAGRLVNFSAATPASWTPT